MNKKYEFSKLEEELYNYFKQKREEEIPFSTQFAIKNAFNKEYKKKKINIGIPQIIAYAMSFIILSAGIVFAKDIVGFIKSLFNNSTESIETATQNGYIQNINMEFIYSNDLGVKVDYITMDDTNLDISYVYQYNKKISYIDLYEYVLKDENGNILYQYNNDNNMQTTNYLMKYYDSKMINNNLYKQSILYKSANFPICKRIIFEIESMKVDSKIIYGTWNFYIELDDIFLNRENEYYQFSKNKYVDKSTAVLNATTLKINLELNIQVEDSMMQDRNNIVLKDKFNKEYKIKKINYKNSNNSSSIELEYDIGKYFENIDNLTLNIKTNNDTEIYLNLNK